MQNKRIVAYSAVFLSGFAALVYEVLWQRYLAILLGAHARASAIVLAVFLGCMSMGYAYFGRLSRRSSRSLIHIYVVVELVMAAWALAFPFFFRVVFSGAGAVYSLLGVGNILTDLAVSLLMLGVPTFLMGATLPL